MLTKEEIRSNKEIQTLARTFAKHLVDQGYNQEDLISAATVILDQAVEVILKPKPKPIQERKHLKVVTN